MNNTHISQDYYFSIAILAKILYNIIELGACKCTVLHDGIGIFPVQCFPWTGPLPAKVFHYWKKCSFHLSYPARN